MASLLLEWLNLLGRWVHVIAAIMWIGDSFLFMWMDSSLTPPTRPREGAVAGELWMVHSGGFYEVVKRRYLAPNELPASLHWFKWQAYTTWLSGLFLLVVVYYLGGSAFLVDPAVSSLSRGAAIGLSLAILVAAWLIYDRLWMSPLAQRPRAAAAVSCALVVVLVYALTRLYSGRAAYLLAGAALGTVMAANVWRRIIPAQDQMLAATKAGTPVDVSLGQRAKQRSVHNHYATLPVLFTMLSVHFPSTYGSAFNWVVLLLVMVVGVVAKHVMNLKARSNKLALAAGAAALIAVVGMTVRPAAPTLAPGAFAGAPPVPFSEAQAIIQRRCITCHAAKPSNPSFPQPPLGVVLETPERIHALAPRIMVRAVVTKTMPLGNLTGITEDERRKLGAWIVQGAKVE